MAKMVWARVQHSTSAFQEVRPREYGQMIISHYEMRLWNLYNKVPMEVTLDGQNCLGQNEYYTGRSEHACDITRILVIWIFTCILL